jgi:two-component system C4-dicarboxylate transport response regulator DctD
VHDAPLNEQLEQSERSFLMTALHRHNGAVTEAAVGLGISRKTLLERMRRHRIDKQQFGEEAEGSALT